MKELNNIKTAFKAEWLKTKGLGLMYFGIAISLLLPLLNFIIHIFNERSRNYDGITKGIVHDYIEDNLTGFGGFFILLFIIIVATRIAQTDHKNNGWTFMESQPLSKLSIYTAKFLSVATFSFITIALFFIFNIIFGLIDLAVFTRENYTYHIDFIKILQTFIRLFVLSLGIISVQIMLSVMISGFIWPFIIGFVGFVINIVGKVRQETYDFLVYNNLETGLAYKNPYELNHFFNYSEYLSIFWMIFFFVIGYLYYSKRGLKNAFFKNSKTILRTVLGLAVFTGIYFFISKPIYPKKLENKTIIDGTVSSTKKVDKIQIISDELGEKLAEIPVKDGAFSFESNGNVPFSEYIVDVNGRKFPIVLSKGDHINLDIIMDSKNIEVIQKGTRKAEAQYISSEQESFSMFYDVEVKEKQHTNAPEDFYKSAQEEWNESKDILAKYRTKENIYFGEDFRTFIEQKNSVKMLNAIEDYRRMTSLTDKKFAPPTDFVKELQEVIKKPTNLLLTSTDYSNYKLKELLPKDGSGNADSLIFVKLSQMPKSIAKDQLLKTQLLKVFELTKDENTRNTLFATKNPEFQNTKYRDYVAKQLMVINNQQKGKPLPPLFFEDENGKKVSLNQFKGKYVVIDFWATWCGPCKETSPIFDYQAKKYKYNENIVFLSASVDKDKNKWKLDLKNKKFNVTNWWLVNQDALQMLGVNGIPRFMMIDPQGKIYNADLPRPSETNFQDILDKVATNKNFIFID